MTRFNDEWLIDRTLFDYTMGGGCACCSFNFMPGGITGLIQESMQSELETDAIQDEINSLHVLPWPNDLKDQVWMERVRIRQLLKVDMKQMYLPFITDHYDGGGSYKDWLYALEPRRVRNYFQLSRDELQNYWNKESKYKIHAAFGTVLCGVVEQVANFPKTGYPIDGRGRLITEENADNDTATATATGEIEFEQLLTFDKRCGFTLKNLLIEKDGDGTNEKVVNRDVLDVWLVRHKSLAGPKLLDRNYKEKKKTKSDNGEDGEDGEDNDNENDDNDDGENGGGESSTNVESKVTASFRADRRIVRLVIARIWANNLQAAYLKDMANKQEQES